MYSTVKLFCVYVKHNLFQCPLFLFYYRFFLSLSETRSGRKSTHSLQYFFTGVTPGISFPEFTVVGQLDGLQGGCYDSNSGRVILKEDWVKNSNDTEHWKMMAQYAESDQVEFRWRLSYLMKIFNQTEGEKLKQKYTVQLCSHIKPSLLSRYGFLIS
uniref:MHC class I-like antigen recognition-like domain-containing protein n=1 Tax=Astyanax mexicanus TaxID=7994 RepID=A0A3B1II88_ASTMX